MASSAMPGADDTTTREDPPFILETAATYLEALPGKLDRARGKKAA